jgi:ABC-2 type transport system permease protein
VYSAFQNLAIVVPLERDDGTLKRLRGTPAPKTVYFAGKFGVVIVIYAAQVFLLCTLSALAFKVSIPTDPAKWVTFVWVSALGLAACTALGLGFSSLPRTAKSAQALVTPIVLVLQFTSGVYFTFNSLPTWMQDFATIFPLKWLTEGMRSVFLPSYMAHYEPGGTWQHPQTALVLGAWAVAGTLWAIRSFRWQRRGEE